MLNDCVRRRREVPGDAPAGGGGHAVHRPEHDAAARRPRAAGGPGAAVGSGAAGGVPGRGWRHPHGACQPRAAKVPGAGFQVGLVLPVFDARVVYYVGQGGGYVVKKRRGGLFSPASQFTNPA